MPAVRYFVDRFADAKKGIYVFLADGDFQDLPEVKRYTTDLARAIEGLNSDAAGRETRKFHGPPVALIIRSCSATAARKSVLDGGERGVASPGAGLQD